MGISRAPTVSCPSEAASGCDLGDTLIHIGLHKAASTSLQRIVFPEIAASCVCVSRQELDAIEHSDVFDPEEVRRSLLARSTPGRNPQGFHVISHEELSGPMLGYGDINPWRIAERLHLSLPHAHIFLVVRQQCDYLMSVYGFMTSVKGLETRSLDRFLREEGDKGLFDKLEYDRLVQRYMDLFGARNVLVLPLEMLGQCAERFVKRLTRGAEPQLAAMDLSRRYNQSTKLTAVIRANRWINLPISALISAAYNLTPRQMADALRIGFYTLRRRILTPLLNRLLASSARLTLPAAWQEELRPRFAASNARLAAMTGLDLSAFGYDVASLANIEA